MKEINYVITDEVGIHARPASLLIKLTKGFESSIRLKKNLDEADAKSILGVLGLGVNQGDAVKFVLSGRDEEKAFEAIQVFLKEHL